MDSKTIRRLLAPTFLARSILGGLLLSSGLLWAGPRVVSGEWEYTTTTEGEPESEKVTACLSADEAASMNGDAKTGRAFFEKKNHGRCTITKFELKGNTMSYALSCGARSIENTVTFHGETSEGVTIARGPDGTDTTHIKARRLGACR